MRVKVAVPRPEHVIAAAWAEAYLERHDVPVVGVRANGVPVEKPSEQLVALRDSLRAEPRKLDLLARCVQPILRAKNWLMACIKGPSAESQKLLAAPTTPWQFENVRDKVHIDLELADGRSAAVDVPFVRRDETISLLAMSSAVTAAAMVPIPGVGNFALIPGALLCGARATGAYLSGNIAGGNAAVRTTAKLLGLGVIDFIPVVANAVFTATLLRAQGAAERFRVGDGLIDTRTAEDSLRALVPLALESKCDGPESLVLLSAPSPLSISSGY